MLAKSLNRTVFFFLLPHQRSKKIISPCPILKKKKKEEGGVRGTRRGEDRRKNLHQLWSERFRMIPVAARCGFDQRSISSHINRVPPAPSEPFSVGGYSLSGNCRCPLDRFLPSKSTTCPGSSEWACAGLNSAAEQ